jgi:hypothetical protein
MVTTATTAVIDNSTSAMVIDASVTVSPSRTRLGDGGATTGCDLPSESTASTSHAAPGDDRKRGQMEDAQRRPPAQPRTSDAVV